MKHPGPSVSVKEVTQHDEQVWCVLERQSVTTPATYLRLVVMAVIVVNVLSLHGVSLTASLPVNEAIQVTNSAVLYSDVASLPQRIRKSKRSLESIERGR